MEFTNADMTGTDGLTVDEVIERAIGVIRSTLSHGLTITDEHTVRNMLQIAASAGYNQGYDNGARNREECFYAGY